MLFRSEPTGNLDSKMGAEVMELLHQLNKEDGVPKDFSISIST